MKLVVFRRVSYRREARFLLQFDDSLLAMLATCLARKNSISYSWQACGSNLPGKRSECLRRTRGRAIGFS